MRWSNFVDAQISHRKSDDIAWDVCFNYFGRAMKRRGKFPIPVKVQP